jgi:hypothetical protein
MLNLSDQLITISRPSRYLSAIANRHRFQTSVHNGLKDQQSLPR